MLGHHILALHSQEDNLRGKLKHHVGDITDHLIQDKLLDEDSDEFELIHHVMLTPRQKVSELLKQLCQLSGEKGERAFDRLLHALREIGFSYEARCVEETSQNMSAKGVLHPEGVLEWKSFSMLRSHALPPVSSALPSTRPVSECVELYRSHLMNICGEQRWKSLFPERNTPGADIGDWFVSVQAMHRWQVMQGCSGKQSVPSSAQLGERFCVSDPVQLLMHYPHLYESAMDVDEIEFVKSCMVVSSAGTGKTTLCRQLLGNYTRRTQSRLQEKFPFPVYIQCSEVDRLNSTDWETLLGVNDEDLMTALSEAERKLVVDYLLGHAEQLLLIIDGVDEVSEGMFAVNGSKLSGVLCRERKVLKRASLFITSRSSVTASRLTSECAGLYTLAGFTEEQLKQYMVKRLGSEKGERCMEALSDVSLRHVKEAILGVPLFAVLVAEEYDRAGEIPLNVTSLYGGYLAHAQLRRRARCHREPGTSKAKNDLDELGLGEVGAVEAATCERSRGTRDRCLHSRSAAAQDFKSWSHPSKSSTEMIEKLSVKALELLCQRQRSSSAAYFTSAIVEFGHAIGVLNSNERQTVDGEGAGFEFNHVSYQEYLAATQVSREPSPVEAAKQCIEHIGTGEETWPFWQFLCGLVDSRHLPAIILLLRGGTERVAVPKKLTCFLMLCLLENQSQSVSQPDHEAAEAISGRQLDLSHYNLNKLEIVGLVNVLRQISCSELNLISCGITGDHVNQLGDQLPLVSHVDLSGNDLHGYPLECVAAAFHRSTEVKNTILGMQWCELSGEDGVSIAHLMQFTADLRLGQLDPSALPVIAESMVSSPNLKNLYLRRSNLAGSATDLCRIVELAPNLTNLYLHSNHLTTNDASKLLVQLSGSHIQQLVLRNNTIDDDITTSLIAFLHTIERQPPRESAGSECEVMCKIFLDSNDIHRSCLDSVLEACCGVRSYVTIGTFFLKRGKVHKRSCGVDLAAGVQLLHTGVNDAMARDVADFMALDTSLPVLNLAGNQISDEGARYLATALKTNSTLRVLDLMDNNIGISGLFALLEGMSIAPRSPRALRLNGCPVFQCEPTSNPDLRSLLPLLKSSQCGNLSVLVLADTSLTVEVGIMLAEALKWNKSLVMIGLSENQLDDVFAAALARSLDGNTTLQEVTLNNNQITEVGVQQMMQSPGVQRLQCVWMHGNPCPSHWYRHPLVNSRFIAKIGDYERFLEE